MLTFWMYTKTIDITKFTDNTLLPINFIYNNISIEYILIYISSFCSTVDRFYRLASRKPICACSTLIINQTV